MPALPLHYNTKMSLPVSRHMKLNAKQHGTWNAEDYDRIKYIGVLFCHLKQMEKNMQHYRQINGQKTYDLYPEPDKSNP
jgi:hypothetical protein